MNDKNLRKNMVDLLIGKGAHVSVDAALKNLKPELRNVRPDNNSHSVWELFEHMRIAQEDILRYTLDSSWESPSWPDDYWPDYELELTDDIWNNSVKSFKEDLDELVELANNTKIDLTSEIPHGEGRTYLRELLLVGDHNAYHTGQIALVRKALNNWP